MNLYGGQSSEEVNLHGGHSSEEVNLYGGHSSEEVNLYGGHSSEEVNLRGLNGGVVFCLVRRIRSIRKTTGATILAVKLFLSCRNK